MLEKFTASIFIALMMAAVSSSGTLVSICHTTPLKISGLQGYLN
jgi:hypothetical protein